MFDLREKGGVRGAQLGCALCHTLLKRLVEMPKRFLVNLAVCDIGGEADQSRFLISPIANEARSNLGPMHASIRPNNSVFGLIVLTRFDGCDYAFPQPRSDHPDECFAADLRRRKVDQSVGRRAP